MADAFELFSRLAGVLRPGGLFVVQAPDHRDPKRVLELALYHSLGKLPEPESTHDFF